MELRMMTCADQWRDGAAYRPLVEMDRVGWAWAWLRRNPRYRERPQSEMPPISFPQQRGVRVVRARSAVDAGQWGVSFRIG
ncbi:transcriptional regulator domain-containing protein [Asticcacaulis machinosus]|uniref:transcriptional regulator domain-containing protein n=1 Tax=Asticcacaulis machinosus TaxID=2984211 RepID=UPI0034A1E4F2